MIANEADTTMDNLKLLPTCTVSLIMDVSIDLCWLRSQLVEGWRLWPTSRSLAGPCPAGRSFRPTPGVATPWRGIPFRRLSVGVGSQSLTKVLIDGTSHSGAAGVRVLAPGASRAIHAGRHAALRVSK